MTCLCPKCGASLEMEQSGIPSEGSKTNCPACNARVQIVRESFARMAYGSSSGKSCGSCGGQLESELNCPVCGTLYPDFFLAADPAVIKRQAREQKRQQAFAFFRGIEFTLPSFKRSGPVKSKPVYTPKPAAKKASSAPSAMPAYLPKLIAGAIIVAICFGGGYVFYANKKAERQYVDTYFKALYGIKTGVDLTNKVTVKVSSEWKAAMSSGVSFSPLPSVEELKKLNKVKSEVDLMLDKQLASPPNKLAGSRDGLLKLNEQYGKLHVLTLSPPASLDEFSNAYGKASASFQDAARSLKSTLPENMSEELANAKKKYKNLSDF